MPQRIPSLSLILGLFALCSGGVSLAQEKGAAEEKPSGPGAKAATADERKAEKIDENNAKEVFVPPHFLVHRTGDPTAKLSTAKDYLESVGKTIGSLVLKDDEYYLGQISNTRDEALKLIKKHKPDFGLVSADFYLMNPALRMTPLLEAKLNDELCQSYAIVVNRKNKAWKGKDLAGKAIATTNSGVPNYLNKVLLEQDFAPKWQANESLDMPLLDLVDSVQGAPDGVLMDAAQLARLKADKKLFKSLAVAWTSKSLPAPLIVLFEEHAPKGRQVPVLLGLQRLKRTKEGREALEYLAAKDFVAVNNARLRSCQKLLQLPDPKPAKADGEQGAKNDTGERQQASTKPDSKGA